MISLRPFSISALTLLVGHPQVTPKWHLNWLGHFCMDQQTDTQTHTDHVTL